MPLSSRRSPLTRRRDRVDRPAGCAGTRPKAPGAVRTRRRRTGPDPATVVAVIARDDGACVRCSARIDLVPHHRVNRGAGGSTAAGINGTANLLAACSVCNGWFEDHPAEAYEAGWKVRRPADPAQVPVRYPDGSRWLLDDDGGRRRVIGPE